jgi:hypothetical protein
MGSHKCLPLVVMSDLCVLPTSECFSELWWRSITEQRSLDTMYVFRTTKIHCTPCWVWREEGRQIHAEICRNS